jgi:hypothetical protein
VTLGVRRRGRLTRASYEGGRRSRAPRARPPASRSAGGVDADAMARIRADRSAPGHEAPSRSRREARKRGETGTPFGTDHGPKRSRAARTTGAGRPPALPESCLPARGPAGPSRPPLRAPGPSCAERTVAGAAPRLVRTLRSVARARRYRLFTDASVRPSRDACSRGGEADHESQDRDLALRDRQSRERRHQWRIDSESLAGGAARCATGSARLTRPPPAQLVERRVAVTRNSHPRTGARGARSDRAWSAGEGRRSG